MIKVMKNSQISGRIKNIYSRYYQARAQDKFSYIIKHIDQFADSYELNDTYCLSFLDITIKALVESYFLDVIRYKEYHFSPAGFPEYTGDSDSWCESIHNKKISESKVAAYTAKWLLKYSPLVVLPDSEDRYTISPEDLKKILSINAVFCLDHIRKILSGKGKCPKLLSDESIISELIYTFRFRNFDERHFFSILRLMGTALDE
jgi:hypothetical protein